MRCLKCGRELKESQVFCDICREDMANYPVKPGTPIQLPPRNDSIPRKKPVKKKKYLKPEAPTANRIYSGILYEDFYRTAVKCERRQRHGQESVEGIEEADRQIA